MKNNWSLIIDHCKNKRGFSLIELIVAMTFITIIIFGVVSLQGSNLAMIGRQNNQIQAHFYANQGLQIVKAIGYSGINCKNTCALSPGSSNYTLTSSSPEAIENTPFKRTIQVSEEGLTKAYKVTSIVEWEDATGAHTKKDGGAIEAKLIIAQP